MKLTRGIVLGAILPTLLLAGCGQFIPDLEPETAPIPADRGQSRTPSPATRQIVVEAVRSDPGKYGELSSLQEKHLFVFAHAACLGFGAGKSFDHVARLLARESQGHVKPREVAAFMRVGVPVQCPEYGARLTY